MTRTTFIQMLLTIAAVLLLTGAPSTNGQGYAPAEAVAKMTTFQGLQATLFAAEPDVRQAIFVKSDDRGRVWTIQYLQYPNPAGLERVKVDRWSRTTYDRVPKPPPHGPRGADRITICEDVDGDGRADRFKDFVDGLNLVTGVAFGHGGVFVLNVPYLLFYPDRDRDDLPDSDPEVLLSGFGMEDAQSMSNHLTWGPDGWLYGVNGSTTTCQVRGVEFQSGVWRYHPESKQFELFCEGGYNCYGLTFDRHGELFYSTNGAPFIHAMQGAYYYKSFGKHGPLHNLYAYHHFPLLKCDQAPGGPPTGGTIYRGQSFPAQFRDTFIAGNFLGHTASWWNVHSEGSTFSAAYGGVLLDAHDTWFGPTDMCVGHDGAMYVSDFHDQRTAHPDPDAHWDRRNGRIYKISAADAPAMKSPDLATMASEELVELLTSGSGWLAKRARVELASRRDRSVAPTLRVMALQTADELAALQGVWSLAGMGLFEESLAVELLQHPAPYVRFWAVRLLGDRRALEHKTADALISLARQESAPVVLAQLAASAKRLEPDVGLPIVSALLNTEAIESDQRIPWLTWWAIEQFARQSPDLLLAIFGNEDAWSRQACRANALRLVRRWAAEGTPPAYVACAKLIETAPTDVLGDAFDSLRTGLGERAVGLHGIGQGGLFAQMAQQEDAPGATTRQYAPVSGSLMDIVRRHWQADRSDSHALELALRADLPGAAELLRELIGQESAADATLVARLGLLRRFGGTDAFAFARPLLEGDRCDEVILAALDVIDAVAETNQVRSLVANYGGLSEAARSRARDLFFGRPSTALAFLAEVEAGKIPATETPVAQLAQLAAHENSEIDKAVQTHWGQIGPGSTEEKLATMRRLNNDLRAGSGDAERGKVVFTKHCGICHQLHGEGNSIGPDLTTANRSDRNAMLHNLVDPSAVIRRDYASHILRTDEGRAVSGLLAEQDAASITLVDAQNRRIKFLRDQIEEIVPSEVSLMPERLWQQLTPEQLRDLFSYMERK